MDSPNNSRSWMWVAIGLTSVLATLAIIVSLTALTSFNADTRVILQPTAATPMAKTAPKPAPKEVAVEMHDPGCHWFSVNGKYVKTLSVSGGAVSLANYDEATLKISGTNGVQRDVIGGHVVLPSGAYTITMVGQASDDNTLKLNVS